VAGIGERAHLTSPQVCPTTQVTDVVNTVMYEDLRDKKYQKPTATWSAHLPWRG
jgi:hypothetical protein